MKKLLSIIITLLALAAPGVKAFVPFVKNWTQADYDAANQNWAVAQDSKGRIYVGNHTGLLEYDGCKWTLYQVGRSDVIRSVYVDGNDRIYVGAQNDFGYFERDVFGQMNYTSLLRRLEGEFPKKDLQVWSIVETEGKLYFQTYWGYFSYDGQKVECTEVHFQLSRLSKIDDKIYYFHRNHIFQFVPGQVRRIPGPRRKENIKYLVPFFHQEGKILAVTEKNGLICYDGTDYAAWKTDADELLENAGLNRAVMTADSTLIVGTVQNGIFAFNSEGHLLWQLNADNFLQNNTVLDILCDKENNIWLALDCGVSMVRGDKSVSIKKLERNIGSIFDVEYFGEYLYAATNQGLFRMKRDSAGNEIELVPEMSDFVLSLYKTSDNMLIVGHRDKTVIISPDGKLRTLSARGGGMCTRSYNLSGEEYIMMSTYTGFSIYGKDKAGEWMYLYNLDGFDHAIRCFETDADGRIWAGDARTGLYCIETDKDRTFVRSVRMFNSPSSEEKVKTGVFRVKDRLVFTDGEKCYVHDDIRQEIVPYTWLNDVIGEFAKAHDIVAVNYETYWFITDKAAVLVSLPGVQRPKILKTIVYKDYDFIMLDGRENIIPVNDENSLLCVHNALALIKHGIDGKAYGQNAFLVRVSAADNDGKTQFIDAHSGKVHRINYSLNNLSFDIAYPSFGDRSTVRYRLSGLDDQWHEIPDNGMAVYNRLPYGKYAFEFKNADGEVSKALEFKIKAPFYLSVWAWLVYALILAGVVYLSIWLTKRANEDALKKLKEQNEKEIIRLENERLKNDIANKGKQLSSSSMNLIRRSEMLQELLAELDRQKEALGTQYPNKYYNKMRALIESNLASDEEWEVFQTNFDLIHKGFFRILSERYPELSPSDLKLCALLRLNMDTKEIAQMINITVRGVETRRYRLRQKLGLKQEDSLSKFLIDIK